MNKVGFLFFSGSNFRAIVTLCRYAKANGIPFYIFAMDAQDPIFLTAYRQNVVYVRKSRRLTINELKPEMERLIEREQLERLVLGTTSEFLNTFFLNKRTALETETIKIPLVDKPIYDLVTNKETFTKHCEAQGITVPAEYEDYQNLDIPFVAKPKANVTDGRTLYPQLILSESDRTAFIQNEPKAAYFYQEFIKGESYYLFYHVNEDGTLERYAQKNLAQQPEGKSIIWAESAYIHEQAIGQQFEEMLLDLKYTGIIMIEIIKKASKYYLIEANPRFWGPFKLVAEANPNFIRAFFAEHVDGLPTFDKQQQQQYLWFGGFIQAIRHPKAIKWYVKQPKVLWLFLLRKLKFDVYFKKDTWKYFIKEWKEF